MNLTVLMPVSAVDEFFPIAIESIKNQTYRDYICHIICGDLEKDELDIINKYISGDDRFELHHLQLNGIAFALNYGINLVKTKYIARMDSDDFSYPTRFEKQINFLESNPNHVMLGCRIMQIDHHGEEIAHKFKFFQGNKKIKRALKYRMPMCHPAMMFRSEVIFKHKGYMYGNTSEDHEMYLRIARDPNNKFENLSETLHGYRRHGSQLSDFAHAMSAYTNIGGFLFTEFLRTWNPIYLVGVIANHPILRKARELIRKLKGIFS